MENKFVSEKLERGAAGRSMASYDPRKKVVSAALKAASGATKVTMVVQCSDGRFSGHCMNATTGEDLGYWAVRLVEVAS